MLLAEEFVLLALDLDGRPAHGLSNQPAAAVGVTGALVTELVQEGHVDVADGRIRLTGTRPTNPLLAEVLDSLAVHEGKKLKSRLGSVKHSGWAEVVDAMVASGILGREKDRLRPTRHPVCDQAARVLASYGYAMEYPVQRYLRDVRFTLIGGGTSEILKMIIAKEMSR